MSEQEDHIKSELLQDLMSVEKVMEELYKYHPDNPNSVSIVDEYKSLQTMRDEVMAELGEIS